MVIKWKKKYKKIVRSEEVFVFELQVYDVDKITSFFRSINKCVDTSPHDIPKTVFYIFILISSICLNEYISFRSSINK